jgi:hypothetical protein
MPSVLVNRYAVYFHFPVDGKVAQPIAREPSLLMAVESSVGTYRVTGHVGYLIEDTRKRRQFVVDRDVLLRLVYLKRNDRTRYFEILNRLDRDGNQEELVSFLVAHAPL